MPIFSMPIPSSFGQNVKPFDGAKLTFYESGTTTPKTTYQDRSETTAHASPVVADGNGRFAAIYLSGTFKALLQDKNDVTIWTEDDLTATGGQITYLNTTDFDSTTNAGDYPSSGALGDGYRVGTGFTLNAASGSHILQTGDFIVCNKAGATGIDADWDILRGTGSIQGTSTQLGIGAAALADGANIATDCSDGTVFTVTLGGNRTLDNPTNKIVGQKYTWQITQDGTGDRTLAFGTDFDFNGLNEKINPTAARVTTIRGTVVSSTSIQCVVDRGQKAQQKKGLLCRQTASTTVQIEADSWTLYDASGEEVTLENWFLTLTMTGGGAINQPDIALATIAEKADTFYDKWLIYNRDTDTKAGLLVSNVKGTCDANTANKLTDSSENFNDEGVAAGDRVFNNTDHTYGYVGAVDSDTVLGIVDRGGNDLDLFPAGTETYTIERRSPTMPSGFTFKARIGSVFNDNSSNFFAYEQIDNLVVVARQTLISAQNNTSYAVVPLELEVPTFATKVFGDFDMNNDGTTASSGTMSSASKEDGGGEKQHIFTSGSATPGYIGQQEYTVGLLESQNFWAKISSSAASRDYSLFFSSYELGDL